MLWEISRNSQTLSTLIFKLPWILSPLELLKILARDSATPLEGKRGNFPLDEVKSFDGDHDEAWSQEGNGDLSDGPRARPSEVLEDIALMHYLTDWKVIWQ